MSRKAQRAPVAVALIVKDGAKTLGPCLKSLRPYVSQIVVCVDERTTDATAKVAARHGADVIASVRVSDWHECPTHGRVLAQHFGDARNVSFGHLDPDLPFWLWIDADDVLKGGEHLAALCAAVPANAAGCWFPYHYATINGGAQTTTLFDRERLLRSTVGWRWGYRVHEVVVPIAQHAGWITEPTRQLGLPCPAVYHQEGVHKTEASTTRNQLLLEIDWEERPDDQRTAFYLANGFFAAGDMPRAAAWYEKTIEIGTNPWEVWQSCCYLSIAHRRMGNPTAAAQAAFAAIDGIPDYKEGYFRLAEAYLTAGEYKKAIDWTRVGLTKQDPPRFVFVNPLDVTVNSHAILSDAYAGLGHVTEARRHLAEAHRVAPSPETTAGVARYAKLEEDALVAQAFVDLAPTLPEEAVLALYAGLPDAVKAFGRTRDVAVPLMLKRREERFAA
jgi:hypothetical protein